MIVVDLEFEMSDIRQLKLERSVWQIFVHYVYSIVKPFFKYQKEISDDFVLYDNGMKIVDSFIPYECEFRCEVTNESRSLTVHHRRYLVKVSDKDMVLLAKLEGDRLVPADSLIKLSFDKKIDPRDITNNMYYHLKYNDVSLDVLKFKSVKVAF